MTTSIKLLSFHSSADSASGRYSLLKKEASVFRVSSEMSVKCKEIPPTRLLFKDGFTDVNPEIKVREEVIGCSVPFTSDQPSFPTLVVHSHCLGRVRPVDHHQARLSERNHVMLVLNLVAQLSESVEGINEDLSSSAL